METKISEQPTNLNGVSKDVTMLHTYKVDFADSTEAGAVTNDIIANFGTIEVVLIDHSKPNIKLSEKFIRLQDAKDSRIAKFIAPEYTYFIKYVIEPKVLEITRTKGKKVNEF